MAIKEKSDECSVFYSTVLSSSVGSSAADIISMSESGNGEVPAFILFVSDEVED